jgi:hypothetical protein
MRFAASASEPVKAQQRLQALQRLVNEPSSEPLGRR